MTTLVTGASGFVGSAVAARLRAEGERVIGVARRAGGHPDDLRIDLSSAEALDRLASEAGAPDAVVHAAARAEPWGTAAQYRAGNVVPTATIVRWAASLPRRPRLVHLSTASVLYSGRDRLDVAPDEEPGPRYVGGYARTKAEAERIVRRYPGDWVILRPRAVFGPGDTALLPRLLEAADRGRLPRFRRTVRSDLVYVDDLVEDVVRMRSAPRVAGLTLAVTGPESVDLQQLVAQVLEESGRTAPTRTVPRSLAVAAATAVEAIWRVTRPGQEPPITAYALRAYAFSFTFARAAGDAGGAPRVPVEEAVRRTVDALSGPTP